MSYFCIWLYGKKIFMRIDVKISVNKYHIYKYTQKGHAHVCIYRPPGDIYFLFETGLSYLKKSDLFHEIPVYIIALNSSE